MELIGMVVIGFSFLYSFPNRMNYDFLIVGIAFFSIGYLVERFVLRN
tara:strand:+ start:224 stop:364 length:141 start_codon:yes stop_codon:yes gene_type:complete